eukprot:1149706-Pelagomonas_calceolata.AAC.2
MQFRQAGSVFFMCFVGCKPVCGTAAYNLDLTHNVYYSRLEPIHNQDSIDHASKCQHKLTITGTSSLLMAHLCLGQLQEKKRREEKRRGEEKRREEKRKEEERRGKKRKEKKRREEKRKEEERQEKLCR